MRILLYSNWTSKVLQTYLEANGVENGVQLEIEANEYGSLLLKLRELTEKKHTTIDRAIVILDDEPLFPGVGLRSDARIDRQHLDRMVEQREATINELISVLEQGAQNISLLVIPPITPPAPLFPDQGAVQTKELQLRLELSYRLSKLHQSSEGRVKILDTNVLFHANSFRDIFDDRLLFSGGWPFSTKGSDLLAESISRELFKQRDARKIIITDADNTLWNGLLGDDGVDAISWEQESDTYRFHIYQNYLNLLMSEGVLVSIASKNSQDQLNLALQRKDLVLDVQKTVSQNASWEPKSSLVKDILAKTNLLPSSVVFIDDSEFEIGEVLSVYPEIKTLKFPNDNTQLRTFLEELRACFDTSLVTKEDISRAQTIRTSHEVLKNAKSSSMDEYLMSLDMVAEMEIVSPEKSERAFQLLNKTNQFNLSGRRFSEEEWKKRFAAPNLVTYQIRLKDKHADYGIISVLLGDVEGNISDWVLSCRVFSRTLEHFCLNEYIKRHALDNSSEIKLHFKETGRNHATREFLMKNARESSGNGSKFWIVSKSAPLKSFVRCPSSALTIA